MKHSQQQKSKETIQNYVHILDTITMPTCTIKEQLPKYATNNVDRYMVKESDATYEAGTDDSKKNMATIFEMVSLVETRLNKYPKEKIKTSIEIIKDLLNVNNGVISTKMIDILSISRQCLSILEKNNEIERIGRGIYIDATVFEDTFYTFQLKHKKIIFSHMNALYFHHLTEEVPYSFTVTVPSGYHDKVVNEKSNVFYVPSKFYKLGLCEVETSNGNKVRVYNLERSICDIIRSKNRLDFEQVKKSLRQYVKREDKNLTRLSEYAKKMNIEKEVSEMVGMYFE